MKKFGILNITPDSFSDANRFMEFSLAIEQARHLAKTCDVIDIGPQSTRPNSKMVTFEEEISRLGNIVGEVSKFAKTSIDSFYYETQKFAASQGASYINDVSAFVDGSKIMLEVPDDIKFVFMHHVTIPARKDELMKQVKSEMIREIKEWALGKIEGFVNLGVSKQRLVFDVGIGFGKSAEQSIYLIDHAEEFLSLGVDVMFGHSRKSFINLLKPEATIEEKDKITQEISKDLDKKGIQWVRVHC